MLSCALLKLCRNEQTCQHDDSKMRQRVKFIFYLVLPDFCPKYFILLKFSSEDSRRIRWMWQKYIYLSSDISSKLLKKKLKFEGEWKEEISQDFHISHNIFSLHNNCTKKSRTERQEEKMKLILTSTLLALLSPWRDPSTSDGSGGIMVAEAKVRDRSH